MIRPNATLWTYHLVDEQIYFQNMAVVMVSEGATGYMFGIIRFEWLQRGFLLRLEPRLKSCASLFLDQKQILFLFFIFLYFYNRFII